MKTVKEICKETGCSHPTILKRIKKLELKTIPLTINNKSATAIDDDDFNLLVQNLIETGTYKGENPVNFSKVTENKRDDHQNTETYENYLLRLHDKDRHIESLEKYIISLENQLNQSNDRLREAQNLISQQQSLQLDANRRVEMAEKKFESLKLELSEVKSDPVAEKQVQTEKDLPKEENKSIFSRFFRR
ncbi:hypothetical protein [Macrococcus sp. S115]|nr:hypothetical protein [Macrococcus sp. S115]MDJ1112812.1 hypothetical protein [Macrococcus sp. S115]